MAESLAHEAYRRRVAYVRELLDEIGDELANDEADAAAEPHDWSYAGTMGRVGELLEQVL